MFYDTHAHFDNGAFNKDRDELLMEIHRQGISLINNIGCDLESSRVSVELAEKYPFIYAVVGHWPGHTLEMNEEILEEYRRLSIHEKVVAIGEIGLDYHYEDTPRDVQKYWFDRQLRLAEELGLPVVVHRAGSPRGWAGDRAGNGRTRCPACSTASPGARRWQKKS